MIHRSTKSTGWQPTALVHPGEHLLDFLEESGISQAELAARTGISKKAINEIVNGKSPITQNTAFKLSKILSVSPEFWINLQSNYDLALAQNAECQRLEGEAVAHAQDFKETYQELERRGFVPACRWAKKNILEITRNLQHFFAVDSLAYIAEDTMEFAFRKYNRKNVNQYTLAAWVQLGKIQAKLVEAKSFDREKLKSELPKIKSLSRKDWKEYAPELEKLLADCGVVLVLAPRFTHVPVQGATHWIESERVLVMLNTEHQYEDRFWFSLFHELGHVLLHGKKDVYVDFDKDGEKTEEEKEADAFAQKWLIQDLDEFYALLKKTADLEGSVKKIADINGVSEAVVAGRITHDHATTQRIYALMSPFQKERIEYSNITFNNA